VLQGLLGAAEQCVHPDYNTNFIPAAVQKRAAVVGTLAPGEIFVVSEKAALFFFYAAPKARNSKRSETHGASKSTYAS